MMPTDHDTGAPAMKGRKTEADCGPQSPGGPRAAAEAQVALQQAQAKLQNEVKEDASSNQYLTLPLTLTPILVLTLTLTLTLTRSRRTRAV
eukprot:scaffold17555_cov30-Phaeocystis_antarctica.AAC.1